MGGARQLQNFRVGQNRGVHWNQPALPIHDAPALVVAGQRQLHLRHRPCPVLGLHQQRSVHDLPGKLAVRVAEENYINARHLLGQIPHVVFFRIDVLHRRTGLRIAPQAGMNQHHNHIRLPAQLRNQLSRHLDRIAKFVAHAVLGRIPARDRRRYQPEQRHPHPAHPANDVGLKVPQPVVIGRDDVRAQDGKPRFSLQPPQGVQTEVPFMVADGHGVVAHGIHRRHHRVRFFGVLLSSEVSQRRALEGIAAIHQQRVRLPGSHLTNVGRDFGQAALGVLSLQVVVGPNVAVNVRGSQDGQSDPLGAFLPARDRRSGQQQRQPGHARTETSWAAHPAGLFLHLHQLGGKHWARTAATSSSAAKLVRVKSAPEAAGVVPLRET